MEKVQGIVRQLLKNRCPNPSEHGWWTTPGSRAECRDCLTAALADYKAASESEDRWHEWAQGQMDDMTQKLETVEGLLAVLNAQVDQQNEKEVALEAQICALREALEALGSKPDGYCFCVNQFQVESGHTGECLQAQQALFSTPVCKHKEESAQYHKLWQESCSDAYAKAQQLATLQAALDEANGKIMKSEFNDRHGLCWHKACADDRHSWTRERWIEEAKKEREGQVDEAEDKLLNIVSKHLATLPPKEAEERIEKVHQLVSDSEQETPAIICEGCGHEINPDYGKCRRC